MLLRLGLCEGKGSIACAEGNFIFLAAERRP